MTKKISNPLRSAAVGATKKSLAVKKRLRSGLNAPGEKLKENRAVASIKKTREEVEKLDSYIEEFEKKLAEKKAPAAPKKPAPKAKKVAKKPVEEGVSETPSKKVVKDELAWIYSSQ